MGISDKTRKLLWGKSGSTCAICKRELILNSTSPEDESIIGEFLNLIENVDLMPELGLKEQVRIEFQISQAIDNLDMGGFWVFGGREKRILEVNGKEENWRYCSIKIM